MKKLKFHPIENNLFKAPLSLYIGDHKAYNKQMKKLGYSEDVFLSDYKENAKFWYDGKVKVIFSPKNKYLILHEVVHYCINVMETRGIPINAENDEVLAYMIEHIYSKIMKKLKL